MVGASGYIASRTIPLLLEAGHEVVAAARTPAKLDRFWWREQVTARPLDVLDDESVRSALTKDLDALIYLVHGMAGDAFQDTDRQAATAVRAAADTVGIDRLVYVSGIIPDTAGDDLSDHLQSRLEVEQILNQTHGTTITLRAAMIIGAGSTSYSLMSQLARRLPVTVLPDWMNHLVEPLAVADLVAAITGALTAPSAGSNRYFDIGGGEQLPYPDLIARYLAANNLERPSIRVPLVPQTLVGQIAARVADVPNPTVRALIESLSKDMVATDRRWIGELVGPSYTPTTIAEGLRRAEQPIDYLTAPSQRDSLQALPGGPYWTR
ncbi:NAD-dependent epimerase/dehydratase OS=Tsukamurella paurometabola (strain ATCC 8368 / DSM /CCUG 35730 / CIP 100753 / JCM 10117 / KCTC 9821 / NBRC 16120/ NCIMB 702349 / NCTC 13040) OX=521096 GN=Tpau_4288 PE=4 SV=1 [Tsukamurella paurometabola]|nr:Putative NADH-flavin reductase [Tsukamurella paurometabola]